MEVLIDIADNIFYIISQAEKEYDTFTTKYMKDNKLLINPEEALKDNKFIEDFGGFLFAITCLDYANQKTYTFVNEAKEIIYKTFKEKYNTDFADFIKNYQKKISKVATIDSLLFQELSKEKNYEKKSDIPGIVSSFVTDYKHIKTVVKEDLLKAEYYLNLINQ